MLKNVKKKKCKYKNMRVERREREHEIREFTRGAGTLRARYAVRLGELRTISNRIALVILFDTCSITVEWRRERISYGASRIQIRLPVWVRLLSTVAAAAAVLLVRIETGCAFDGS